MEFFGRTRVFTFDNGVRLGVMARPGVSFQLLCGFATGSIHEEEHLGRGLSHIMEHMLFQGCEGYPGTRVNDLALQWSASLNAYTSYDRTVITIGGPAAKWSEAMAMVLAMARTPEIAPAALAGELDVILRECAMYADKPTSRLFELTMATLFRRHPLRHPVIGYPELIRGVTAEMLHDYHRRRYTPDRCVIAIAGAVDPETVRDRIGELVADWRRSSLAEAVIPDEAPPAAPRIEEAIFTDPLARIDLGVRIPGAAADPEAAAAAEVMLGVLGMGRSSVLLRRLERELRLAVSTNAVSVQLAGCGAGFLSAAAPPGKLDRLDGALRRTVAEFRRDGVTAEAVRREQRQRGLEAMEQMESASQIASGILDTMLLGESPAFADRTLDAFRKVGVDEVRDAARRLLDPERFAVVRLRPAPPQSPKSSARSGDPAAAFLLDGCRGLRCAFERRPEFPLVRFAMTVPGGAIAERDSEAGVSDLLAAAFTGGTRRHGEERLLTLLDGCGAALECTAGNNTITFSLAAPRSGFARAFTLLREMLTEPAWRDDVIDRERRRLVESLRVRLESPLEAARIAGQRELFGAHPYHRGGEEVLRSLRALDRDAVEGFFRRILLRDRIVFGFGGDLTEKEATRWLAALDADLAWSVAALPLPPPPEFPAAPRRLSLELDREQAIAMRVLPGVVLGGEHPPMSDILSRMENGLASEFGKRMREENHLAYHSGFFAMGGIHPGSFTFYAATAPDQLARAAAVIDDECERLAAAGVAEAEFTAARDSAVFAQRQRDENPAFALLSRVLFLFYGETLSAEETADEIAAIGRDEFNRWLREHFRAWRNSVAVALRPTAKPAARR